MNKRKYKLNANKNSIEKDDKYFAYFNIIDAHKITRELNKLYEENNQLKYDLEYKQRYINQLLKKPFLTDILPQAVEILATDKKLHEENDKLRRENHDLRNTLRKIHMESDV